MNVAMIPARGGSKRIPKKNVRQFISKPIIAYSIEAALRSNCFDRVIVSTDNSEIAEIAIGYGAEVPFFRPAKLSDDFTATIDVIRHAIEWFSGSKLKIKYLCCIYATAPFIHEKHIRSGLKLLETNPLKDYAYTVCCFPHPIERALKVTEGEPKGISMCYPEYEFVRTQDLEPRFHDIGQFCWGKGEAFMRDRSVLSSSNSVPIVIPKYSVIDIDDEEDWQFAERMFSAIYPSNVE